MSRSDHNPIEVSSRDIEEINHITSENRKFMELAADLSELNEEDVTDLHARDIITTAKMFKVLNNSGFYGSNLLGMQMSVSWAMACGKVQVVDGGADFVTVRNLLEREENNQLIKFWR